MRALKITLPLLLAAVGCDSQTNSDYRGETLAQLRGVVYSPLTSAPPAMEVQIVWDWDDDEGDRLTGQKAQVQGEFPASFTLDLTEPPPAEVIAVSPDGKQKFAYGYILAKPVGATIEAVLDGEAMPAGTASDYIVAWTNFEFETGSYAEMRFGHLLPGFNLLKVTPADPALEDDPEAERCDDFYAEECEALWPECEDTSASCLAQWDAYQRCEWDAQKAADCWRPPSWQDRLEVAPEGFASLIELTITDDPEVFDEQGPNIH